MEAGEEESSASLGDCVRCKKERSVLLLQTSTYCASCADLLVAQRTRQVLDAARGSAMAVAVDLVDVGRWRSDPSGSSSGEKSRREAPPVAIAFSGGVSSRCLLRVALELFSSRALGDDERSNVRDPVVRKLVVLYVDESVILPGSSDQTEQARAIVEEEARRCTQKVQSQLQVTFVPLHLQDVYDDIEGKIASAKLFLNLVSQLSIMTPKTTTPTSASLTRQTSLRSLLVAYLLRSAAREHGAVALLLGDTATRSAIRLFEALSSGEGFKWPVEGAEQAWVHDLYIARPLLTVPAKLAAFYVQYHSLRTIPSADITSSNLLAHGKPKTVASEKASISRLTESFILSLEHGVPSTVSTITRTAGKLSFTGDSVVQAALQARSARDPAASVLPNSSPHRLGSRAEQLVNLALGVPAWDGTRECPLCGMPAEEGASTWKAQRSITSRADLPSARSSHGTGGDRLKQETLLHTPIGAKHLPTHGQIDLAELLCYSCILVLETPETPISSDEEQTMPLPPYVYEAAQRRIARDHSDHEAVGDLRGLVTSANILSGQPERSGDDEADPTAEGTDVEATHDTDQHHIRRKVDAEEMRQKLAGFLLDEEDDDDVGGARRPRLQRGGTKESHRTGVTGVDW